MQSMPHFVKMMTRYTRTVCLPNAEIPGAQFDVSIGISHMNNTIDTSRVIHIENDDVMCLQNVWS